MSIKLRLQEVTIAAINLSEHIKNMRCLKLMSPEREIAFKMHKIVVREKHLVIILCACTYYALIVVFLCFHLERHISTFLLARL